MNGRTERFRDWVRGGLLLAATLLAYRPAWYGHPVWDDAAHLTKPALRSLAGLARIWTELGATQQYYPLLHSAFWVQHWLWGGTTLGYHLVNIGLHVACALLLVKVLRRLGIRGAWFAGAIFALHPVMVESVAWMTELKNTLSGVFFLGAAAVYLKFDQDRRPRQYALALGLFVAGLLSKSVVATLPAVLLVTFWWARGRIAWRRDVRPLLPFLAVGTVSGLFTAWVERTFIGAHGAEFAFGLVERGLIAGRALWFYLYKLLWPAELIFIYPRWRIDATAAWQYLFPAAFLALAVVLWRLRKRSRAPLAVLLYFAGTLFPVLGFLNVYPFRYSFVADHFQYLASIGPIAALAAMGALAKDRIQPSLRWPVHLPAAGLVLALLFGLTWRQSGMYVDAETLYRTTVARNDACWMAHTHLGLLLMETGRGSEAERHLQRALELHPEPADARSNLGLLLTSMGRMEEARAQLEKALEVDPRHADAHNNLGILLARLGRPADALAQLELALALAPEHPKARYNLGDVLSALGRNDEAMTQYHSALRSNPFDADVHNNLGLLFAKMDRAEQAVEHFRRAVALSPDHANAHNNLGVMLVGRGSIDEAIAHYRAALAVDPVEPSHLENLVSALLKRGLVSEATAALQNGLALAAGAGDRARATAIGESLARLRAAIDASQSGRDR